MCYSFYTAGVFRSYVVIDDCLKIIIKVLGGKYER
jgi:hypothetical protein